MYLIGPVSILMEQFPNHDFSHARKSIPGDEVVIEEEISADLQDQLEYQGVLCLNHEDTINYLNDSEMAGIWFPEEEEV